jgi:hypothetical protein
MASASQVHPSFPPRNTYGASNKLPDRTAIHNNPPPFSQSSLSRRPDQLQQYIQQPSLPPQHTQPAVRQTMEKEINALQELSEEQREEINEAVCYLVEARIYSC